MIKAIPVEKYEPINPDDPSIGEMFPITVTQVEEQTEHSEAEVEKTNKGSNGKVEWQLKSDENSKRKKDNLRHHEYKFQSQEKVVKNQSTQTEKNKEGIKNIHKTILTYPHYVVEHLSHTRCVTVPCRSREIVGREKDLRDMKHYLLRSDQTEKKIALCGPAGIGKTTIVHEYAYMVQAELYQSGVFWLSGQNVKAFDNSMRRLAAVIGTTGSDPIETQAKTFNWISLRQDRCLIVLDNLDEEEVNPTILSCITDHGKTGQNNHVIVTTRRSADKAKIDFNGFICLPVSVLSDTDSAKLFRKVLGNEKDENDNDIETLCSKLHGLPLAIEQAATTIQLKEYKISDYIEEFQEKSTQLLENRISHRTSNSEDLARQSVWTTWSISLENIKDKARSLSLDHAVRTVLPLLAYLSNEEITIEFINDGEPEIEDENLRKICGSEFKKLEVIRLFKENSVLRDSSNNMLEIHPLVQEFIRSTLEPDEKERRRIAEVSVAMLSKACEEAVESTVSCARLENHCVSLQLHFEGMGDITSKLLKLQKRFNGKYWDLKRKDDLQPLNLTAEPMVETSSNESVWSSVRELEKEQEAIQAVGVCFNPDNKQFDVTVVSKEPKKIESRVEDFFSKRSSKLPSYMLKVRHISEEEKAVTDSEEYREFFKESGNVKKQFAFQQIISKHSVNLLKNNRNVTGVFFSPVKSSGYGTSKHRIEKEPCVAIYVKVKFDKNRFPLWSKKIPNIIDGIKTDVREAYLETFMQAAAPSVLTGSGCEINAYQSGTLGPFVCSQSGRTGFLASLHVLLSPEERKNIISPSPRCGMVESHKSVYKAGGQELASLTNIYLSSGDATQLTSGFEVGLIVPASNIVARDDALQNCGLEHYDGEITAITEDNCDQLLRKVGAATGLTVGRYAGPGSIRFPSDESVFVDLMCQIGVHSAPDENNLVKSFAQPGDSGALVTIREGITDKLVGIVTGGFEGGPCVVTPIQQISDRLLMDGWKICTPTKHNDNCWP